MRTRTLLKMLLATLLMVLVICAVTTLSASADDPEEPQVNLGELTLQISFQEDGSWRANIDLGTSEIRPTSEPTTIEWTGLLRLVELTPEFLEQTLLTPEVLEAMGIESLRVPTETVEFWMEKGVQHLAVQKTSLGPHQEINLYANGEILASVKVSDGMVDLALQEAGKEVKLDQGTMALLGGVLKMGAKAVLRFPVKEGEEPIPVSFEDKIERVTAPPSNVVKLGATVSGTEKETTLVSAAGITLKEVNELLEGVGVKPISPTLPTTVFADYEIEKMQLVAGRNGVKLTNQEGNEERSLEVLWDSDSREAVYKHLPAVGEYLGWQTLDIYTDVVESLENIISETKVEVTIFNEEASQEGLPTVHIGQPVVAELAENGDFSLLGLPLGKTAILTDVVLPYFPVATCFDGGEVRTTIKGESLPIVRLEEGLVERTGEVLADALAEFVPGLEKIPWGKGDSLIKNINVEAVVLAAAGEIPEVEELNLDYTTEPITEPFPSLVFGAAVDRKGNIEVGGISVICPLLEQFGIPASENIKALVEVVPPSIQSAEVTVDPNRVVASLNDEALVSVLWGERERRNTAYYLPIPDDLPLGLHQLFPTWKANILNLFSGANRVQWGLRLEVKEEIPPRGIEEWFYRWGILPKRPGR